MFHLPNSSGRSRHCAPVRVRAFSRTGGVHALTPEHAIKKEPTVAAGPARVRLLAKAMRLNLRPLTIREDVTVYRHPNFPFGKLESEITTHGNPKPQQTLDRQPGRCPGPRGIWAKMKGGQRNFGRDSFRPELPDAAPCQTRPLTLADLRHHRRIGLNRFLGESDEKPSGPQM